MKGKKSMALDSPLRNKLILIVDDEPDVLDVIEEILDICNIHRANDYETAVKHIENYTYDAVILDIMGVNGFELLKKVSLPGISSPYAYCP